MVVIIPAHSCDSAQRANVSNSARLFPPPLSPPVSSLFCFVVLPVPYCLFPSPAASFLYLVMLVFFVSLLPGSTALHLFLVLPVSMRLSSSPVYFWPAQDSFCLFHIIHFPPLFKTWSSCAVMREPLMKHLCQ